mmetsp:Transcript_34222/g.74827  ORF Transcript_34222/g.74827 Transcript_34222/m.74827 type:complete len:304 (-) Transcript_34222:48-959(-)
MMQVDVRAKEGARARGGGVELGPLAAVGEHDALRARLCRQHSDSAVGLLGEVESDAVCNRVAGALHAPHFSLLVVHASHTDLARTVAHDGAPSLGMVTVDEVPLTPHMRLGFHLPADFMLPHAAIGEHNAFFHDLARQLANRAFRLLREVDAKLAVSHGSFGAPRSPVLVVHPGHYRLIGTTCGNRPPPLRMMQVDVRAKEGARARGGGVELGPLAAVGEHDALRARLCRQHSDSAVGLLGEVESDAVCNRVAGALHAPHFSLLVVHASHTDLARTVAHDGAPSLGMVTVDEVPLTPHYTSNV